jgi:hypothetical protein
MAPQSIESEQFPFVQSFLVRERNVKRFLLTFDQARDYVIDSNYTDGMLVLVDHRQTAQIIFVE